MGWPGKAPTPRGWSPVLSEDGTRFPGELCPDWGAAGPPWGLFFRGAPVLCACGKGGNRVSPIPLDPGAGKRRDEEGESCCCSRGFEGGFSGKGKA